MIDSRHIEKALVLAVFACMAWAPAGAAGAAPADGSFVPGEVIVGGETGSRVLELPSGVEVAEAVRTLRRSKAVSYAQPNWIATASLFAALDKGSSGTPGGWQAEQWNFLGRPGGVRAVGAWKRLSKTGRAGGAGVTVAVVDSGLAYASADGYAPSPDFDPAAFLPGIDLVDDDGAPLDENGHGTHVAGTIAEQVTVDEPSPYDDYLTGLAYGVRLMPIRVLDERGEGEAADVADGIVWAAKHGADVINVSLQFRAGIDSCVTAPDLCAATRKAKRRGALVVAAAGNTEGGGEPEALFPGAAPAVLAVSATTEHGCLAAYSHYGERTDLLAPGGGQPLAAASRSRCTQDSARISQLSYGCYPGGFCTSYDRFAIRSDVGTSMSAAHASAAAALVIASGVAGTNPTPRQLTARLRCTARRNGPAEYYGPGLLDAGRAVDRRLACARL